MVHGAVVGLLVLGIFAIAQTLRSLDDTFLTAWAAASQRRLNNTNYNATTNTTVT